MLIKDWTCAVSGEEIAEPLIPNIRNLDNVTDELIKTCTNHRLET
jgi:hypothetical protein